MWLTAIAILSIATVCLRVNPIANLLLVLRSKRSEKKSKLVIQQQLDTIDRPELVVG